MENLPEKAGEALAFLESGNPLADLNDLVMLVIVLATAFYLFRFWRTVRKTLAENAQKIDALIAHPSRIKEGTLYNLKSGVPVLGVRSDEGETVILAHGEKADALYRQLLSRGVKLSKAKNPATIQAILGVGGKKDDKGGGDA